MSSSAVPEKQTQFTRQLTTVEGFLCGAAAACVAVSLASLFAKNYKSKRSNI